MLNSVLILTLSDLNVDDFVIKGSSFELRQLLAFIKVQRKVELNPKGCDTLYLSGGFRGHFRVIEIISVDITEYGKEDFTKNIETRYPIIVCKGTCKDELELVDYQYRFVVCRNAF